MTDKLMKQCPRCHQTYSDDQLNFCLDDGELLTSFVSEPSPTRFADDPPPTLILDQARVTNPASWSAGSSAQPPAQWQNPSPQGFGQFGGYAVPLPPNQTLAIVSLCLGIASVTVGWCCSLGLLLSPAALITGFIALSQIKKDPQKYTGKGLAIGGVATASVFLAIYIFIIVIYGAAILFGGVH